MPAQELADAFSQGVRYWGTDGHSYKMSQGGMFNTWRVEREPQRRARGGLSHTQSFQVGGTPGPSHRFLTEQAPCPNPNHDPISTPNLKFLTLRLRSQP